MQLATPIFLLVFLLPSISNAIDHPTDYKSLGIPIPIPDGRYFFSGGLCASISHGITTPIDVVKTRIQSEPTAFRGLNLIEASQAIIEQNGYKSLLGGLGPTVIGYGLEGAAKFGLYESLKPTFGVMFGDANIGNALLCASITAGAVASLILCPLERARIRLVTDPSFSSDNLLSGITQIAEEDGVFSLFGGFTAMLLKQVPYTIAKQVSFDVIASLLYSTLFISANMEAYNIKAEVSILSAFLASILACIASHPGDVLLTDSYKGTDENKKIPSAGTVIKNIYQSEGMNGFFTGITARFFHVGAIITSQLVLYDFIKQLLGLPATGSN